MVLELFKMFWVIFTVCSFGTVYAQVPVVPNPPYTSSTQSTSYPGLKSSSMDSSGTSVTYSGRSVVSSGSSLASSGTATAYTETGTSYDSNSGSTVSSSGSLIQQQPPVAPTPGQTIGWFAHYIKYLLSNNPVLNVMPDFVIPDAYSLLKNFGKIIKTKINVQDLDLVEPAAKDIGPITKDLYLSTVSHTLAKLLYLTHGLNQDTALTYPRIFLSYVEGNGGRIGVHDDSSVVESVENGFLDFLKSVGRLDVPNLKLALEIFLRELRVLARGEDV